MVDRNVAISNAGLSLNPSNLPHKVGQVAVSLVVFGADHKPLAGKAVVFSSNFGSLAGNGSAVYTDSQGLAGDTLSLSNIAETTSEVTVSAQVGSLT